MKIKSSDEPDRTCSESPNLERNNEITEEADDVEPITFLTCPRKLRKNVRVHASVVVDDDDGDDGDDKVGTDLFDSVLPKAVVLFDGMFVFDDDNGEARCATATGCTTTASLLPPPPVLPTTTDVVGGIVEAVAGGVTIELDGADSARDDDDVVVAVGVSEVSEGSSPDN
jgi:hypothetical protein